MDVFKNIGAKVVGQTLKKAAKTAATKAVTTKDTKTGEHVGKKAGDKIIQMLSKSKTPKKVTFDETVTNAMKPGEEIVKILSASTPVTSQKPKPMSQQEINDDRSGCRNVSDCHRQFFSELHSPRRSHYTNY